MLSPTDKIQLLQIQHPQHLSFTLYVGFYFHLASSIISVLKQKDEADTFLSDSEVLDTQRVLVGVSVSCSWLYYVLIWTRSGPDLDRIWT